MRIEIVNFMMNKADDDRTKGIYRPIILHNTCRVLEDYINYQNEMIHIANKLLNDKDISDRKREQLLNQFNVLNKNLPNLEQEVIERSDGVWRAD